MGKKIVREFFPFSKPFHEQFTPGPGEFDEVICEICGAMATVERNCIGPTTSAEAMGGHKHMYDRFKCPVNEEEPEYPDEKALHARIYRLEEEMKNTASSTLKGFIENDLKELMNKLKKGR